MIKVSNILNHASIPVVLDQAASQLLRCYYYAVNSSAKLNLHFIKQHSMKIYRKTEVQFRFRFQPLYRCTRKLEVPKSV